MNGFDYDWLIVGSGFGGAVVGGDDRSVVDRHNRIFGYRNLLVCDGAAMPANPGVNRSLTITALAGHAVSHTAPA